MSRYPNVAIVTCGLAIAAIYPACHAQPHGSALRPEDSPPPAKSPAASPAQSAAEKDRVRAIWAKAAAKVDTKTGPYPLFEKAIRNADARIGYYEMLLGERVTKEFEVSGVIGMMSVIMRANAETAGRLAMDRAIARDLKEVLKDRNSVVELYVDQYLADVCKHLTPAERELMVKHGIVKTTAGGDPNRVVRKQIDLNKLLGRWKATDVSLVYIFGKGRRLDTESLGLRGGSPGEYEVEDEVITLKVVSGFQVRTHRWIVKSLTDDELVVDEGGYTLTYKRQK